MAVPRRSGRSRFTLVLLVLTALTLLTLDYRGFRPIDGLRSAVLAVFSPVGDAASNAMGSVTGGLGDEELRRQNDELRQRIEELEGEAAAGEAARRELEKLQQQLDLPFVGEIPTVRARVSSGAIANFDDTIEIDKGSNDGIDRGMAVVAGAGLVGQVVQVSGDRAVVKLLSDRGFQVGVRVAGAPGLGVVSGTGEETRLHASQFDVSAELKEGDVLVTSGASRSLFPPDVPVGTIRSITTNETALLKEADVRPAATLSDLTYVTVLRYSPDGAGSGDGR